MSAGVIAVCKINKKHMGFVARKKCHKVIAMRSPATAMAKKYDKEKEEAILMFKKECFIFKMDIKLFIFIIIINKKFHI